MSGFCEKTGIFELSWSKMSRYVLHRFPDGIPDDLEIIVEQLIRSSRYTYLGKTDYGYKLVANDAQIWELLANKPATFGFTNEDPETTYRRWLVSREWFNATELGKELKDPISAVKVNKILERLGFIKREAGGWIPSELAVCRNLVKPRPTESAVSFGNQPKKPSVLLHRDLVGELVEVLSAKVNQ